MTVTLALFRKQVAESRWVLGISSAALFGFGWLGVYIVARGQRRIQAARAKLAGHGAR